MSTYPSRKLAVIVKEFEFEVPLETSSSCGESHGELAVSFFKLNLRELCVCSVLQSSIFDDSRLHFLNKDNCTFVQHCARQSE